MSLIKLLSAGQSLTNPKRKPSHYKLSGIKTMPKFGSGKTFSAAPAGAPAPHKIFLSADGPASIKTSEPPPAAPPREKKNAVWLLPVAWPATAAGEKIGLSIVNVVTKELASLRKHNPFTSRSRARQGARSVPAGESLDTVKVVRNDLHDADCEIVPGRPAHPIPELVNWTWQRVASRFGNPARPDF